MDKIHPFKLKLARHKMRLSMDELVARMGDAAVSKMSISKMERGLLRPSQRTLQAIARVCNVPESFFYMDQVTFSDLCFRYVNDQPTRKAKMHEADVLMKIGQSFAKEQMVSTAPRFVNPLHDIRVTTYREAEDAATRLRQHILIGTHPIHSVYEMLQELGVMVIDVDVNTEELLGASTYINNVQPVVIVNTHACTTTERQRFTALHELAHLLLRIEPATKEQFQNDNPGTTLKPPTVERLCHWFANAMLICQSSLQRRLGNSRTDISLDELISIRNMYGISIAATVHRAHDLGIIPDDTYNHLYDNHINKNRMEEGWGAYPITEKADRYELLEERIMMENGEWEGE